MSHPADLLIIGAGTLGSRVAAGWRAAHPEAAILAETSTARRHDALSKLGVESRLRDDPEPPVFPNLLFSIPPSGQGDYPTECQRGLQLWSQAGRFVMVSSTAVYAELAGGRCIESSPLTTTDRAHRLLTAEELVLAPGGTVVRLAGLYDGGRGPHMVYSRKRSSNRRPDGLINLIHYGDAAVLCTNVIERGARRTVYLGCDNTPITRSDLVKAAASSVRYSRIMSSELCQFTGVSDPLGRRCDNASTRQELGWQPQYPSFLDWLDATPSDSAPEPGG